MADKKTRKSMNNNLGDYLTLCGRHPEVQQLGTPVFIGHAYYPVAVIDMEMTEKSFEDFQPIEGMILRCVGTGISSPSDIARLLALPDTYAETHYRVLEAKGQIADGALTVLGEESIAEQKLVQISSHSRQRFQADAIYGILLPADFNRSNAQQFDPAEIQDFYLTVKQSEDIDTGFLISQLKSADLAEKYRRHRRSVLNTNVESVDDISLVRITYIPVLMVWFDKLKHPMFFFQTYQRGRDFLPLFKGTEAGGADFGNPDVFTVDLRVFDKMLVPWMSYVSGMVPAASDWDAMFAERPFRAVKSDMYGNNNAQAAVLTLAVRESDSLTFDDLNLIAAGGNRPVPTAVWYKKNGRTMSKTFIPYFQDAALRKLADKIRELRRSDFSGLQAAYNECIAQGDGPLYLDKVIAETISKMEGGHA